MIALKGKFNTDCKIFINDVEEGAIDLIRNILDNEISEGVPVRIMPDTHVGKGIVIGFTMPITDRVNPNYIGVDIGCSVTLHKLNKAIKEADLPKLDHSIRRSVPMGMHIRNEKTYDDWWVEPYLEAVNRNLHLFSREWEKRTGVSRPADPVNKEYISILCGKIGIKEDTFYYSIGTLGGGNHFIEVGKSVTDDSHYLTIHSGSRNFGLKVCNYHAKKMKATIGNAEEYENERKRIIRETQPKTAIPELLNKLKKQYHIGEKEQMLKGEDMYAYLIDMVIAQTYAQFNHQAMSKVIFKDLGEGYHAVESICSMHNFIDTTDGIIRKGAIRSYKGEKMVIPFNMRDGVLICEGKSNPDWNYSAPHGAGRVLARNTAKKTLDMDDFERQMKGIYSTSVCPQTLDESPMAYKDKDMITEAIRDTAIIIDTVKPIMNIKAPE